jgi:hypothetical protein
MLLSSKVSLVYLVYGSEFSYYQVIFSILNAHFYLEGDLQRIDIVIYTNNDTILRKYLKNISIKVELLTDEDIRKYRGLNDFNHRMKILIIKDCIQKYRNNVLYMDGDTFFVNYPLPLLNKISNKVSVMHIPEYDMYGKESENCHKLILRRTLEDPVILKNENIKIPLRTIMWNAGIIGISCETFDLLDDVVSLTDQIYAARPVHTAEQFAFSYILQTKTNLISAESTIVHYWQQQEKKVLNYHIAKFLAKNQHMSLSVLTQKANDIAIHYNMLKIPDLTIAERISKRVSMTLSVAIRGHY